LLDNGSSVIEDWTTITSGGAFSDLSLSSSNQYHFEIRAVDSAGNVGPAVASNNWTPSEGECVGALLTNAPFAQGDGSEADPYLICTANPLQAMVAQPAELGKWFKQGADIDLSSIPDFTPIGEDDNFPFIGVYDANNKAIRNLTSTSPNTAPKGLFSNA